MTFEPLSAAADRVIAPLARGRSQQNEENKMNQNDMDRAERKRHADAVDELLKLRTFLKTFHDEDQVHKYVPGLECAIAEFMKVRTDEGGTVVFRLASCFPDDPDGVAEALDDFAATKGDRITTGGGAIAQGWIERVRA